jgi:hypothetical protein
MKAAGRGGWPFSFWPRHRRSGGLRHLTTMTKTRIPTATSPPDTENASTPLVITNNGTQTANSTYDPGPSAQAKGTAPLDLNAIKVSYQEGVCGELRTFSLGEFLKWIEEGQFSRQVNSIRTLYARVLEKTGDQKQAKKEVSDLKKDLPAITPSGLFEEARKRENLRQYTGIICYDIDESDPSPIMEAASNSPYVVAAFISPTGTGVKLFVQVDATAGADDHSALWQAGKRMVKKLFGVDVDESRKDVTGLCFISTGEVYRNEGAVPIKLDDWPDTESKQAPPAAKKKTPHKNPDQDRPSKQESGKTANASRPANPLLKLEPEVVEEFLDACSDDPAAPKLVKALEYIDPSPENVWREVGMGLKARWGDAAWELFDTWSACGKGYDEQENQTRWDSFSEDEDAGIGLGTIFHYAQENGWRKYDKVGIRLPTVSNSDFCRRVFEVISPTHTMFLQGGQVVCVETINAQPEIVPVDACKAIRLVEQNIQCLKVETAKDGETKLIPVPLSEHNAKLLVRGVQAGELPELKGITHCPPQVESKVDANTVKLTVAKPGYVPETGWWNASDARIKLPPLDQAVAKLKWLYREFDFATPGDRSRALVYPIGISLKLSGFIRDLVPLDFGTANDQQAGKGTRQRITSAFFGARAELVTQSESHIGGTSEQFKSACLAGKPFIQLDNFDHFDCREMEAFLTGDRVRMRDAYGRFRTVDPANHFVFLTSNGLAARRDLALRSWFIRIAKKPEGFQFHRYPEGGIVEHVLANQAEYLGCIYAITTAWWMDYCKRTNETRHSFREFTQVCDQIAQRILGEAPVMEGRDEAVEHYSDAGRVFFSRMFDVLQKRGKLNVLYRAGQLSTMAFRFSIPIPGTSASSRLDERAGAKLIGSLAADMFDSIPVLDLGNGRTVERQEGRAAEDWDSDEFGQYRLPRVAKETFCYVFKLAGEHTAQVGEARKTPQPAPTRNEHRTIDALDDFRKSLMAALADAGSPAPCTVTTAQIAGLFENCSAHAAGKWMAKLAARYPAQFTKSDSEQARGWRITG